MRVIILGSGSPIPDGIRCSASTLVQASSKDPILFDCGTGIGLRLEQAHVHAKDLDSIFLTHLHMDHCLELPSILFSAYLGGRTQPLSVFGPPGLIKLKSLFLDEMFPYLKNIVKRVTGKDFSPAFHEIGPGETVAREGLSVQSGSVSHGDIISYGYRLQSGKKIVSISGDTEPCDGTVELARGSDLLVHECVFPDSFGKTPGHTIPSELSLIAGRSRPKQIVLTHLFPACSGHEKEMIDSVKTHFEGEVLIPQDLDHFDL